MKRKLVIGLCVLVAATVVALGGRAWWVRHRKPDRQLGHATGGPKVPRPPIGAIYPVAGNLYVIPEGGGNTAVFVTANGVLLVDTKYLENYQAMVDEVKKVTDKPITHVVNTHCHTDHCGGNVSLPASVEIIVQENTAENIEEMRRSWDTENAHERAMRTFSDRLTLFDGKDAVDLYYFGPAHTDGDAFVVFREARVMHAGDVFAGKAPPIINLAWGGDGRTYGETIAKAAAEIKGVDRVIPGHSAVASWADFVDYGEFNRFLLDHARAESKAGKDEHQALADLALPAKFKDYKLGRALDTIYEIYSSLRR